MDKYILPEELKNKNIISITPMKNKKYGIIVKCLEQTQGKIECSFYAIKNGNVIYPIDNKLELGRLKNLYFTDKKTSKGFIEG